MYNPEYVSVQSLIYLIWLLLAEQKRRLKKLFCSSQLSLSLQLSSRYFSRLEEKLKLNFMRISELELSNERNFGVG